MQALKQKRDAETAEEAAQYCSETAQEAAQSC
jgi:hypothetical protein